MAWLASNLGNIVVILIVAAIAALAVRSLIRDKRAGKGSCGGNCSACSLGAACTQTPPAADVRKAEQKHAAAFEELRKKRHGK